MLANNFGHPIVYDMGRLTGEIRLVDIVVMEGRGRDSLHIDPGGIHICDSHSRIGQLVQNILMLLGVDLGCQRVGVDIKIALVGGFGILQHCIGSRHMEMTVNIDGEVLLAVGDGAVVARIARRGMIVGPDRNR